MYYITVLFIQIVLAAIVATVCAEADPALLYNGLYGYGAPLAYSGLAYNGILPAAYSGYALPAIYGKSAPCVNAANQPVPCAAGNIIAAGHIIAKREAEAEADPALLYNGLYGYGAPLAYSGLAYSGLGYSGLYQPYAYGLTHPSNLGICTNNYGVRVPC